MKKLILNRKGEKSMDAQYFIEKLNMEPHVEGGYFKESFTSADKIKNL